MKTDKRLTDYLQKEGFLNPDDQKLFLARWEAILALAWDIYTEGFDFAAKVAKEAISKKRPE